MSRLVPALIVSLLCLGILANLPLAYEPEVVVPADGDTTTLELSQHSPVQQTILATGDPISAVTIFSPTTRLHNQVLQATVSDEQGHLVTKSTSQKTTVTNDRLSIRLPLPTVHTYAEQPLRLTISLAAGQPVQLIRQLSDQYPNGRLFTSDYSESDLALTLDHPAPTSFGWHQGLLIGVIVLLSTTLVIYRWPQSWWAVTVLSIGTATLMCLPFWYSLGSWGINDWDYRFSLHEIYRRTLLVFHQFPWWNPYICGGAAGLADPEFSLLSVTFIPELFLGVVKGIRVSIWLSVIITSTGMLALSKQLRLSPLAGWLAALAVTYTSGVWLKITEGHETIVFAFMWLPWIWWSWLRAYRRPSTWQVGWSSDVLLTALFLALVLYQGGIYILFYIGLAVLILPLLVRRSYQAWYVSITAGLWALGFSAFKLIPVISWLHQFPDQTYVGSTGTWPYLSDVFLGRYVHGAMILPNQVSGWHEYGAFIGIGVLCLTLLGLSNLRKSNVTQALAISAALAILLSTAGPWLTQYFDNVPFIPRSNISRLALLSVLPIGLLAGQGLDKLQRRPIPLWVSTVVVGLVALELFTLSYQIAEQAFVIQPPIPRISPAPTPLTFTANTYPVDLPNRETPRAYAPLLAGYGTFSFCSVLGPESYVSPNTPYASISSGDITVEKWTPNTVSVKYTTTEPGKVVINTNYAKGWQVNGQAAEAITGRVGTAVSDGSGELTFMYKQPGRVIGILLTAFTVLAAAVLLLKRRQYE